MFTGFCEGNIVVKPISDFVVSVSLLGFPVTFELFEDPYDTTKFVELELKVEEVEINEVADVSQLSSHKIALSIFEGDAVLPVRAERGNNRD